MNKLSFLAILFFFTFSTNAQNQKTYSTEKVWRINLINPGVELELPTGIYSTLSTGVGIGYGGSYRDVSWGGSGFVYVIAPFLDVQQKWFYNLNKRILKERTVDHNSGNFLSLRLITRGNSIAENVHRTSDFDFAFGPTWGIQRKYGENFHLLFDVGPQYYMDTEGNGNIFPIMFQLNLGFDL